MGEQSVSKLRDLAHSGQLSVDDLRDLLDRLSASFDESEQYDLLSILGNSHATEYVDVVVSFLQDPDPMLQRLALMILCDEWNMSLRFRDELLTRMKGVDGDALYLIRDAALLSAASALRQRLDLEILSELIRTVEGSREPVGSRHAAYVSLAMTVGEPWPSLPLDPRRFLPARDIKPSVLEQARRLLTSGSGCE